MYSNPTIMKATPLVLAGSLLGNITLAAILLHQPDRTAPGQSHVDARADAAAAPAGRPQEQNETVDSRGDGAAGWRALRDDDLATFTRNLRAAGLADYLVRAIITAEIDERFRAREEALAPKRPRLRYWQVDTTRKPLETRLARLDLNREKERLRHALLGDDPDEVDPDNPIPAEKWALAKMISEDYDALISEVRQPQWGPTLPSERAMLEKLEAERRRELAALLTPEELAEYEFRTSPDLLQLRYTLAHFDATESEFRAIYALRRAFEDEINRRPDFGRRDGESSEERRKRIETAMERRQEAEQKLEEDLRAALGDERYQAYRRSIDRDYLSLRSLAERVGVPSDHADQLFDLRNSIAAQSTVIGNDASRSVADREAAIRATAARFRESARALLGPEAAQAYLDEQGGWLRMLEQGHIVSLRPNGMTSRPIDRPGGVWQSR